jgi:hypothetical protein
MLAQCGSCGVRFLVPDERAANRGLMVRCRCGTEFALHEPKAPRVAAHASDRLKSSAWRRCANHPQVKSESVCASCGVGFCRACEQRVRNVPVCPRCEGLCTEAARVEEDTAREKQRARSMSDDIGFITAYPFSDPPAYVMLGIFTGFFSLFSGFAMGVILSKGVLVWYGFTALTKVSVGNVRGYMPNFGDIIDIVHPLRLSLAAFLAASWPLILVIWFFGAPAILQQARGLDTSVVHAHQVADEQAAAEGEAMAPNAEPLQRPERGASPALGLLLFVVAALWHLFYMPMALIVAAISRGFFKTLNPLIGLEAIAKMGAAYWFAAGIYFVLTLAQVSLERLLGLIPIAGALLGAFVAAYAWLAAGCALGLAVFKKARELNLD